MTDPHLQREFDLPTLRLKPKKKVYVSGPMTGVPYYNFPAFDEAAARLRGMGYEVVNPADKVIVEGWEWTDYLRHDIKEVCDCEAIFMLEGWEKSAGAQLEIEVARGLGLEVLYE
jgi:hypothetical protein